MLRSSVASKSSALLLLLIVTFSVGPKTILVASSDTSSSFPLPPLPYDYSALEPFISKRTLEIHHDKHHAKYVNTLNSMIQGVSEWKGMTLVDILKKAKQQNNPGLFNNAAQSWNHEFYWNCMKPPSSQQQQQSGGSTDNHDDIPDSLFTAIRENFGSFDEFLEEFAAAGNTAFGSGWAWLVYDVANQTLLVTKTIGAENPFSMSQYWIPILTMDVWEHAYYLDYQNMRPKYVETFLQKLVNWDFVAQNLENAKLIPVPDGEL